jgi:hypothetical protein
VIPRFAYYESNDHNEVTRLKAYVRRFGEERGHHLNIVWQDLKSA